MPEPVQIIRTSWSVGKCSLQSCWARGIKKTNWWQHLRSSVVDIMIWSIPTMWQFPEFWCFFHWLAISRLPKSRTYATDISFVQAYGHGGRSLLIKYCLLSADAWLHPLFWGPCLLVWTFWFVIRLRIYEFGLWLRYHDRNYFLNQPCIQMGSDIASWRMSISLFYGMVYGMVVKNYLGKVSFSFIFLTSIFIYFKKLF